MFDAIPDNVITNFGVLSPNSRFYLYCHSASSFHKKKIFFSLQIKVKTTPTSQARANFGISEFSFAVPSFSFAEKVVFISKSAKWPWRMRGCDWTIFANVSTF